MAELEMWRPVTDYEGWYEVSDLGRVRRTKTGQGTRIGRCIGSTDIEGYLKVDLTMGSATSRKRYRVHRLVARAFLGACPDGYEVNHKDGVKTNCTVGNLEYVTSSENTRHAFAMGLTSKRGEKSPRAQLTNAQVLHLKSLLGVVPRRGLATYFGCSMHVVNGIAKSANWAWLGEGENVA